MNGSFTHGSGIFRDILDPARQAQVRSAYFSMMLYAQTAVSLTRPGTEEREVAQRAFNILSAITAEDPEKHSKTIDQALGAINTVMHRVGSRIWTESGATCHHCANNETTKSRSFLQRLLRRS